MSASSMALAAVVGWWPSSHFSLLGLGRRLARVRQPAWARRLPPATPRVALALGLAAIYGVLFEWLLWSQGAALFVAAAVPVIGAAALLGLRPGLLAALLLVPLDALLFHLAGLRWEMAYAGGGGLAHALIGLFGIVVGALHDLVVRARWLAREAALGRDALLREQEALLQAQQALQERARLEGVLLAARTAQHELNNKLALAAGYAELLLDSPALPASLRSTAVEARRGALEAADLVDRLRSLTRIREVTWGATIGPTLDLTPEP